MTISHDLQAEWLSANGLGGFASGTVGAGRTRRYHALLLSANAQGRFVLVSGFDAWVETTDGTYPLSSQHYADGVVHPDGRPYVDDFTHDPWPKWNYRIPGPVQIEHQLLVPYQSDSVVLSWRMVSGPPDARLVLRPLLAMRDYHGLCRHDAAFRFEAATSADRVRWTPRPEMPSVEVHSNGRYEHEPVWYYDFLYPVEQQRGLDHAEDLASPGTFRWDLAREEAVWIASAVPDASPPSAPGTAAEEEPAPARCTRLRENHRRRQNAFGNRLERAADAYLIRSGQRRTIVAGYPWFTDWGRDTFIAVRGLCLATGRLGDCQEILLAWSECVDNGMLPNRFPDRGADPEFNSVDASLWYIIAVDDFLQTARQYGHRVTDDVAERLNHAVQAILSGYARGTRFGIRADDDGLLAAGQPGVQLTWMDAKVDDWVVTPRTGKAVEVQALWINALAIASPWSDRWSDMYQQATESFRHRFWNEDRRCLYDVIDVDHQPGRVDDSIRPNQIFALGGLPRTLLDGEQARGVLETVERQLVTPLGLRTLAPDDPRYHPVHHGGIRQRDGAYHQGTAWLWLAGAWMEAWLRWHGDSASARQQVQRRWVQPLIDHIDHAGLGHLSEIADGDAPHTPRGCPFQAWSLGELLRIQNRVLA